MSEFKRTQIVDYKQTNRLTADNIYWKRLDFPVTIKEFGFIHGLDFSPVAPYTFAVSHSTKVDIYDPNVNQPTCSLTRFKKASYGNSFRRDGKLLVVGGEDARVKLFSVETRSQLRSFKGHESAVHCCKFSTDDRSIFSFSDDRTIRRFDVSTEKELCHLDGHTDYVRCGTTFNASADCLISGSYDHIVRVWDTRQPDASTLTMDHGYPVEAVLLFPNDSLIVSAGGTLLKVWDIAAGGRLLTSMSNHHKTITSMCFSSSYRRLLSGSLDRHVKIYDAATYQVVHTLDFSAAVVKIGISNDDNIFVAGMVDGLLSIQHRQAEKEETTTKVQHSRNMNRRMVIQKQDDVKSDTIVPKETKKNNLAKYDRYLRTFQHSKALDCVLTHFFIAKRPEVPISLIRELIRRRALKKALAGRKNDSLVPIISLIINHISRTQFTETMIDLTNDLIDLYGDQFVEMNERTKSLVKKLNEAVNRETSQIRNMALTVGALSVILKQEPTTNVSSTATDDDVDAMHKILLSLFDAPSPSSITEKSQRRNKRTKEER